MDRAGYPERDPDPENWQSRSRDSKVRDPDRDRVKVPTRSQSRSRRFKSSGIPIPKFVSGSGFVLPYKSTFKWKKSNNFPSFNWILILEKSSSIMISPITPSSTTSPDLETFAKHFLENFPKNGLTFSKKWPKFWKNGVIIFHFQHSGKFARNIFR